MKAMIVKELRENARYAGLALLAMLLVLVFLAGESGRQGQQIIEANFQLLTQFGFAALGILLGATQTLREGRLDKWSFLVHRPMSRTHIFVAKLIAATVLYLLVCGVIIAGLAWWGATPGHVAAPFTRSMLLPALADALGGIVWYVGTLLTCSRRARWYGSRVVPLCVPLIASLLTALLAQNFFHVIIIDAIALAILLPAAWGSFITAGNFEPQPRAARTMQWISVGLGMCLLTYVGGGVLVGAMQSVRSARHDIVRINQYAMLRDGRVVRGSYETMSPDNITWTDLDGKTLDLPNLRDQTALWKEAVYFAPLPIVEREELQLWRTEGIPSFRSPTRYLQTMTWNGSIKWYFVPAEQRILGFDSSNRRYGGGIGPSGFVAAPARPEPFNGMLPITFDSSRTYAVVLDRSAVYHVDPPARKIEQIFTAPTGETILGGAMSRDTANDDAPGLRFITTNKSIHVLDPSGQERFQTPIDRSAHTHVSVGYVRQRDSAVVWYTGDYQRQALAKLPQRVIEFGPGGQVLRDVSIPPIKRVEVEHESGTPTPFFTMVSPAEIGLIYAATRMMGEPVDLSSDPTEVKRIALTMSLSGLLCAAAGYLLARRFARRPPLRLAWAASGFAFALPGVLTMLSVPQKPGTVPCPSCGKRRLVTRQTCEHCGAPFPPPAPDGTEIFE
jgi:hypothetical protein